MIEFSCFDCETVPNSNLPEGCRPQFDEASVKLGVLKDRFKIEEKMKEERAKFEANLDKVMSLDPDLCQVCCFVGYTSQDKKFFTGFAETPDEEALLLMNAWKWFRGQYQQKVPVVSFNGKSFDLPILRRRAMLQDVSVPPVLYEALTERYRNKHHIDLIEVLANRNLFSGKPDFKSLDYYLRRFGLGSKFNGMTGADVYPMFKEGEFGKIMDYCRDDVMQTVKLWERVSPWVVAPSEPNEPKTKEGE